MPWPPTVWGSWAWRSTPERESLLFGVSGFLESVRYEDTEPETRIYLRGLCLLLLGTAGCDTVTLGFGTPICAGAAAKEPVKPWSC